MFKRVLLLLALMMAVLVAPGVAVGFQIPLSDWDNHNRYNAETPGTFVCDGEEIYPVTFGSKPPTTSAYWGPTAVYDLGRLYYDFEFDANIFYSTSDIQAGTLDVGLMDSSMNLVGYVELIDGRTSTSSIGVYGYGLTTVSWPTQYSPPSVAGTVTIKRQGDSHTMTIQSLTKSVPMSDAPVRYVFVLFRGMFGSTPYPPDMALRGAFIDGDFDEIVGEPCLLQIYDADTRLPLSGAWDYYVVIEGADAVSGSASGASTVVYLPETPIFQPHLLRVTKEGYVQVPEILAINVPAGGREIPVYLRSTTAAPEEGNVWLGFTCTDADTGSPVSSALVNLDGSAQYTGASGYVRFQVPMNSTHKWVASSSSHWPMGGTVTVETADLNVSVELVRKTSDLPRPPLPDLPNFPVIHPVLDPSVFRAQILDVPILGGLASPILDTMDAIAVGLDDIVHPILDFVTAPADSMLQALEGVGNQLTESVATYTNIAGVVLGSVGKLLAVFPDLVVGLVTYNLVLDLVYLLLRGGL